MSDESRQRLIALLTSGEHTLRGAAQLVGIPYNNAKVIYRVYRREGRVRGTPKHLKRMVARFQADPENFNGDSSDPRVVEMKKFLETMTDTQVPTIQMSEDLKETAPGSDER